MSTVVVMDDLHVTATLAVAGGAPATARAVTVMTPGGTSNSVGFTVTAVRNPPVTWLNETDLAAEADFAVLQFPATFTNTGAPHRRSFGRLFETRCDGKPRARRPGRRADWPQAGGIRPARHAVGVDAGDVQRASQQRR